MGCRFNCFVLLVLLFSALGHVVIRQRWPLCRGGGQHYSSRTPKGANNCESTIAEKEWPSTRLEPV